MKALVINNHTKHLDKLMAHFPGSDIIEKENLREGLDISLYDLLILSGGSGVSPVAAYPAGYAAEFRLIKESTIPVLGICLGSEIIAYAFDGTLQELPEIHRGAIKLDISDAGLEATLCNKHIEVHESHRIAIRDLPKDFIACATSAHGVEIIKHISKPIIGIQFHPEMDKNEDLFKWIFRELGIA
ncbi:MAG: gamma-glutamyl-gamma-aminobutyrate hydrolase family protein [Syntrophales bacterium]|nr:gamma-glutamyl-gamma-aminobutyrate hydrolase family protein [Syntrophales bacterium]